MRKQMLPVLLLVAAADEDAMKRIASDWSGAFNAGDAKAVAALYAEDGDHIDPTGVRAVGRTEVEKMMALGIGGAFKGVKIEIAPARVRMVKPDVAIVDGTWSLTGGRFPPALSKGLYTMVMVKRSGRWWIESSRPMIPVVPPEAAKK